MGLPAGGTGEIFEPFNPPSPYRARLRLRDSPARLAGRAATKGETPQRHASNRRKLLLLGCCGADGAIEVLHRREPVPPVMPRPYEAATPLALHGSVSRA